LAQGQNENFAADLIWRSCKNSRKRKRVLPPRVLKNTIRHSKLIFSGNLIWY